MRHVKSEQVNASSGFHMCRLNLKMGLIILVMIGLGQSLAVGQQNSKKRPVVISSLYIAEPDAGQIKDREPEFRNRLSKELAVRGFSIIADRSQADAVLSIKFSAIITLDGDGSVPDYSVYDVFLYARDQSLIKKWKIRVVSQSSIEKEDDLAIKRIAEKLEKEKKKVLKS